MCPTMDATTFELYAHPAYAAEANRELRLTSATTATPVIVSLNSADCESRERASRMRYRMFRKNR